MEEQRKSENALVPVLRFEGFSDPWEQHKLGDVARELSTGKSVNSLDGRGGNSDVCILKTSCVSGNTFDPNERKQVVESEQDIAQCPVEKDTVIVSRMNTSELVGCCGYCASDLGNLFLPDRLWKVTLEGFVDPYFIYTLLASATYQARLKSTATGTSGSMKNIAQLSFLDLNIPVTKSDEQQRIGFLFRKFDSLIALHQRKHEKLKTVKQSLLEKMFPKEGEDVPEIRFEGFTDPWEQRKVGEILHIAFRAVGLEDDKKYQLVTVKRRNEGIVERARMAGRDILVKSYQEILAGDFVISKRQLVHGGNGLVPPHLSRSIVSNEYLVIEESKDISTEFWALISQNEDPCIGSTSSAPSAWISRS